MGRFSARGRSCPWPSPPARESWQYLGPCWVLAPEGKGTGTGMHQTAPRMRLNGPRRAGSPHPAPRWGAPGTAQGTRAEDLAAGTLLVSERGVQYLLGKTPRSLQLGEVERGAHHSFNRQRQPGAKE